MFHLTEPMRTLLILGVLCGAGSVNASEPSPHSSETNFYLQHTQPLIDVVLGNLRDPSDQRWQTLFPSKEAIVREAQRDLDLGMVSGATILHIRKTILADGGAAVAARGRTYTKRSLEYCRAFLKREGIEIPATTTARVLRYGVERKPPPADRRRVYDLGPPHDIEITFGSTSVYFEMNSDVYDEKLMFLSIVPMGIVKTGEHDLNVRLLKASPCYRDWQDRPNKVRRYSHLLDTLHVSDIRADGGTKHPVFILSYVLTRKEKIPGPSRVFSLLSGSYPPPESFLQLANRSLDTAKIVDVSRRNKVFQHSEEHFRVNIEQVKSMLKKEGREISPEGVEILRQRNNLSLEKFTILKY